MTYDHFTDYELLRIADGQAGLIKALAERLEMRLRDLDDLTVERKTPPSDPAQLELF
jgi:hypothetical protein